MLPRELGINGTLRFIVGTELVPGALELNELKVLVAKSQNATGRTGVLRKKSHGVFNGI
jgi:hypothetical protein